MTPEELFRLKKKAKRTARRGRPAEASVLTLTSLMDMITIIVVYLLKTYGSDPVIIQPTGYQKIPMSKADSPIQEGTPVYVDSQAITVESKKIVQITPEGDIEPSQLDKHLVTPLYDALFEQADKSKQMAEARGETWQGRVILVGDRMLKFSTLVNVMYTAGRAEFSEYAFCVIQRG
jgi:hypothetical protein